MNVIAESNTERFTGATWSWPTSLTGRVRAIHLALAIALLGWTAMWAEALQVTALLPIWLDASVFFAGLGLIPLAQAAEMARTDAAETGDG